MRISMVVAVVLVGCSSAPGGEGSVADATRAEDAGGGGGDDAGQTGCVQQPLGAPLEQWSWIAVPETRCGYGTATGFAINPTARSREVVIYLMGGGGCYSAQTCAQGLAAHLDGYGPQHAGQELGFFGAGSIFDRGAPANPLRDATYVFVPYCTGDFHGGSAVASYGVHHVGHANVAADLARIAPALCNASRVVLLGSSAGGFGTVFNYEQVAAAFPGVPVDLIDDSGPPMRPPHMSEATQQRLRDAWGAAATAPVGCGDCDRAWHAYLPFLAAKYPQRRFSLISSMQDYSIGTFFGFDPATFQAGLVDLGDHVIRPLPNAREFFIAGNDHVWLGRDLANVRSGGTSLASFLAKQLSADPGWSAVRP